MGYYFFCLMWELGFLQTISVCVIRIAYPNRHDGRVTYGDEFGKSRDSSRVIISDPTLQAPSLFLSFNMQAVKLYVYDLSNGLARQMSLQLTGRQIDGIWCGLLFFLGLGNLIDRIAQVQAYVRGCLWKGDFLRTRN